MQSFNWEATKYFFWARFFEKSLMIPHFSVADIRSVHPERLKFYGFSGVVFDKDNTLTAPYIHEIYPLIRDAFSQFQDTFGNRIAIMSNHAGTRDDVDYESAREIENTLGIAVLRHDEKKPGGIDSVIDFFKCKPEELVMIGDRIFSDVVFGNRYNMLTIHTRLLSESRDNRAASLARRLELPLIRKWMEKGVKPPAHDLFSPDICSENLLYD